MRPYHTAFYYNNIRNAFDRSKIVEAHVVKTYPDARLHSWAMVWQQTKSAVIFHKISPIQNLSLNEYTLFFHSEITFVEVSCVCVVIHVLRFECGRLSDVDKLLKR